MTQAASADGSRSDQTYSAARRYALGSDMSELNLANLDDGSPKLILKHCSTSIWKKCHDWGHDLDALLASGRGGNLMLGKVSLPQRYSHAVIIS